MSFDVTQFERRIRALPSGSRAPVPWFLDIDGVINIIGRRPRGGWPSYGNTQSLGLQGVSWPICWAPALVELLNLLAERQVVSFRWLTTWEHDAPTLFAPVVGLKLGAWVAAEDPGNSRTWWKLDAIVEHLHDSEGLFVWTDDDIQFDLNARQVVEMLPLRRAVVICPEGSKGITPEDFDAILSAIEELAFS